MSRNDRTIFDLKAGPLSESDVSVARIAGTEALSSPFDFTVDFFPVVLPALTLKDFMAQPALLTIKRPEGGERHVHGIATSMELLEVTAGQPRYRLRIAPKLERLRMHRRSRIFQGLTVPQIVKKVLGEGKIDLRDGISGSYPAREYTVQYRESDFAFVSRLLESEGIFYFFEHQAGKHVLVLADQSSSCTPIDGSAVLDFRPAGTAAIAPEHLQELEQSAQLRSGKVTIRDYDFAQPALEVAGESSDPNDAFGLEVYEYPTDYVAPGDAKRVSQVRLEERRFAADSARGSGTCQRFVPGCTFEASGHPDPALDKSYLLVRVEHAGTQQTSVGDVAGTEVGYLNRFVCLDSTLPYRPRPTTRRPTIVGPQTATVVGASSEEIHPDAHGRVKVQFHWDREGKNDDHASSWVRLGQSWAGQGFGASFVPRVGHEVLVRFLEGNPDRPIIGGSIYNGQHPPPIDLPGEKTKSTLRTTSSLGSNGFNETRIEDAKGQEEVYLHGQKDENLEVLNDKTQTVKANEALQVAKDRSRTIDGKQTLNVNLDDLSGVDGKQTNTILKNKTTTVSGDHAESVIGNQAVTVAATQTTLVKHAATVEVGAAAALTVGGAYAVTVGAACNEAVGLFKSVQVGAARVELVGMSRQESVGKNLARRTGGDVEVQVGKGLTETIAKDLKEDVTGNATIEIEGALSWLAKSVDLKADKITLEVGGKAVLTLKKSGDKVDFGGEKIAIDASSTVKLKGRKIKKEAGSAQTPLHGQETGMSCGIASSRMAIQSKTGKDPGEAGLRTQSSGKPGGYDPVNGTRMDNMEDLLKNNGVPSATMKGNQSVADLQAATAKGDPAIIHVDNPGGGGHFMVVDSVETTPTGNVLNIRDPWPPGVGTRTTMTEQQFMNRGYSGWAITTN